MWVGDARVVSYVCTYPQAGKQVVAEEERTYIAEDVPGTMVCILVTTVGRDDYTTRAAQRSAARRSTARYAEQEEELLTY